MSFIFSQMERFSISVAQESQFEAVGDFLYEDFLQRERCCVTSGLSGEMTRDSDGGVILSALKEGLSLIAIDQEDQSIAGVAINVIVNDSEDEDISKLPRSHQAIIQFAASLKDSYKVSRESSNSQSLHLWMLGVREIHCGKGLARKLTEKTIELAQQHEMGFIESLATAPATLHLFGIMGFETKSEMKLQDFITDDGTPGFPRATSTDTARFTVKCL